VAGLPEPGRKWLTHAIDPGTPLSRGVVLGMQGHIRIGRWLSHGEFFRAHITDARSL